MALVDSGTATDLDNDLLKATERAIEATMNPKTRRDHDHIVLKGMKVAMKDGPNGLLRNLPTSKDPVRDCALGATNLAFMLLKSETPYPNEQQIVATVYASQSLMLQALDVAAKLGVVEITNENVARAGRIVGARVLEAINVPPPKLNALAGKVRGVMKNPEAMQAIKLQIGADRDPRAPQPTLPETEPTTASEA